MGGEPLLAEILARTGLGAADGRALFRYAVDEACFATLKAQLETTHRYGGLAQPNQPTAAVFALYVAEWYRRQYQGGPYRWDSPLPDVISELTASSIKSLAQQGLAWWGLAPRRMAGGEMRLLSLILEGGFPTRLLETRERGRIAVHLQTLIARLEAGVDLDEEAATALSRTLGSALGSYDHEEFHILCAELTLGVIALRRHAATNGPKGISATAWLDAVQPGWRETLPIGLAGDGAQRLLDDLVSGRAERIIGEVGCQRLLVRVGEVWVPALTLEMQGEIALPAELAQPSEGRLRVFAKNALASVQAGELALLDPPAELAQRWLSRRRGGTRDHAAFPFDQPVQVELVSAENRRLTATWPRGESMRSEVMVFADPRGDETDSPPQTLVHLGGGSLSTRRSRVWVLTPPDFAVCSVDGDDPETPIWRGTRHLYEISGSVHAGLPGTRGYRIEVGADADQTHQMLLDGPELGGAEATSGNVVFAGIPRLKLLSGVKSRVPRSGDVLWRQAGGSVWRDWISETPDAGCDHGLIEVVWGDPKSRVPLDRRRIAIVPEGAKIIARPSGERGVAYELENLGGWWLEAATERVTTSSLPAGLEIAFEGRPIRRLELVLTSAAARVVISAPAPVAGGGFCNAEGTLLDNGARVMLDDLRGAFAFSPGYERLLLRGPYGSNSHVAFDGELPLWAASEEITRLLSASSGLDDVVTLELGRRGRTLKVGRYTATLVITTAGSVSLVPEPAAGPARRLDWLSVATGRHRVVSQGCWAEQLPTDLDGPGIVMARQGGRVVGRPTLAPGRPLAAEGLGRLQRATLIARGGQRRAVVGQLLSALLEDSAEAALDRGFLLDLITALDGAPPAAIDALAMLPVHPAALASLAAAAETPEGLGQVWMLERELPFLWAAVPLDIWTNAFDTRRRTLNRLLVANGLPDAAAAALASSAVIAAADALAGLEPMLRTGLTLAVGTTLSADKAPALKEGVQDRLRRTADDSSLVLDDDMQRSVSTASCFRRPGSALAERLPVFPFHDSFRERLDAPLAVALAAATRWDDRRPIRLDAEQVRRARDELAREPQSFADIFAAALMILARGAPLSL
ncbi:STY4851/ECs_5259 family protein [Brevundimonas sp. DC300-4]|uniref:STY4851/ECs_5259 family protein n=1 Tax=Brevundimonas sp. DC300-4 TaxID=2804594 RepID=UPI003CF8F7F2